MTKKARKTPVEASPAPPAYPLLPVEGEDARARFRLQNLMQDYEELLKDTATKRRRLQMERQKLLRLTDEVRFLRRRYKYLTKNAPPTPYQVKTQSQKAPNAPKHKARKSPAVPSTWPQGQEHLPQHERSHREKEVAAMPSTSAILDLNQISLPVIFSPAVFVKFLEFTPKLGHNLKRVSMKWQHGEEADFQVAWEHSPMERRSTRYPLEGDAPGGDLKLSVCRDVGSGTSRPGKRKISWQDQVALKV